MLAKVEPHFTNVLLSLDRWIQGINGEESPIFNDNYTFELMNIGPLLPNKFHTYDIVVLLQLCSIVHSIKSLVKLFLPALTTFYYCRGH